MHAVMSAEEKKGRQAGVTPDGPKVAPAARWKSGAPFFIQRLCVRQYSLAALIIYAVVSV